ncbi:hypothetical protein AAY473_002223 [Plecturocebus cupreus]
MSPVRRTDSQTSQGASPAPYLTLVVEVICVLHLARLGALQPLDDLCFHLHSDVGWQQGEQKPFLDKDICLGMVAHTCHSSTLGGQGGQITRGQGFETSLANIVKPYLY